TLFGSTRTGRWPARTCAAALRRPVRFSGPRRRAMRASADRASIARALRDTSSTFVLRRAPNCSPRFAETGRAVAGRAPQGRTSRGTAQSGGLRQSEPASQDALDRVREEAAVARGLGAQRIVHIGRDGCAEERPTATTTSDLDGVVDRVDLRSV